ncbi:MAG: hypothetical protein H7319_21920 [Spirosoma sp.]|nr:hypothetical protein [Spirosoma sp.]
MNKNNEPDKHPVDNLFAQKLGNAVLATNADGFARLQARMGQTQAEKKPGFVIWRNPNAQRFMAIAACLLLVCLFGWLYLSNNTVGRVEGPQVATTKSGNRPVIDVPVTPQGNILNAPTAERADGSNPTTDNQPTGRVARLAPKTKRQNQIGNTQDRQNSNAIPPTPRTELAQNKPTEQPKTEQPASEKIVGQAPVLASPDQVAAVKPVATQRVLIVTIAEPERLIAARQAVKMEEMETALAAISKPEKAHKPGFWEQVRRVKEGEVFTRADGSDDERGLLNRAFNGLKNSIDKDKTARQ